MMERTVAFFCALAGLSSAYGQTKKPDSAPASPNTQTASAKDAKLPTAAEVDAALNRTLGYDASVTWNIFNIEPSAIPGITEVIVSLNKQAPMHLFLSNDMKTAIIGNVIPFGPDPFAPARALLEAADGPSSGADKPAIRVVEFSDLQCPHCKSAQPVLEKLAADFPQVRFTFQQFPLPASLHPWALKGAQYSDCVAQTNAGLFSKYVDSVFENQANIDLSTVDKKLQDLATAAGLDANQIAACASAPGTQARIDKSVGLGNSLEVGETPTVFINGRRVLGIATIPYEQLKNLMQFEIDHANK